MSVKSILEIDVKDDAFKAFVQMFEAYKTELAKMPAMWADISKSMSESASGFEAAVASLTKAAESMTEMNSESDKLVKEEDKYAKSAEAANKSHDAIEKSSKKTRDNIDFTTKNILKWVGIGGALGLGLDMFNKVMGPFANAVSDQNAAQRSAQQMGVRPAQMQAAEAAYNPYLDVDSLMSNIADAKNKPAILGRISGALHIPYPDLKTKNPAELLPQILAGLKTFVNSTDPTVLDPQLEALGLHNLVTTATARNIGAISSTNLNKANTDYSGLVGKLDISDQTRDRFHELDTGLNALWTQTKNTTAALLVFASTLDKSAWKDFVKGYTDIGRETIFPFYEALFGKPEQDFDDALIRAQQPATLDFSNTRYGKIRRSSAVTGGGGSSGVPNDTEAFLSSLDALSGAPAGTFHFLYGMESSSGRKVGPSKSGAIGPLQVMPENFKHYNIKHPYDLHDEGAGAALLFKDLMTRFHKDMDKVIVAWDGGMNKAVRHAIAAGDPNWERYIDKPEVRNYLAQLHAFQRAHPPVQVTVKNGAGADTIVNAHQLTPPGSG